jgi:hypothetical protein
MPDFQSVLDSIRSGSATQLSLGSAALLVFLVCAVLVVARGMLRIVVGAAVIVASVFAGLWMWRAAPGLALRFTGQPQAWFVPVLPFASGLLVFLLLRLLVRFLVRPFGGGENRTWTSRLLAPLFALVPAGLLCLAGAVLIHHFGSLAEIRTYAEKSAGQSQSKAAAFTRDLKTTLEKAVPPAWLEFLNPTFDHARLTLGKLIARQENAPAKEEPILRAIVVDEKELRSLAREKRYGTLLQHPKIDKALADPKVQKALDRTDL